jgi:hypothetical protein
MSQLQEHVCSGEIVDDGRREYFVCDDDDSPRCPSHKATCTDCKEKKRITCYRGEEPLCEACEEEAYGPREQEDWRESSGRCKSCHFFYHLSASWDRRDICVPCAAAAASAAASAAAEQACDECGKSVVNGRLTCLCPYDEDDLKKMDRQLSRQ